ncbi:unnamed protein product [Microthlaspi erraticum]|uniref:ENT domain-containing protein n=1 Tax=Microthlaspi erraticum TaxID=1685480 RepID=A0A6D2LK83_9BRAS|nr:unnamed protein product [Microthlaspi erraticum]
MADEKDPPPDSIQPESPAEDPTHLPLERSAIAEKSLPGSSRATESEPESDPESESGSESDSESGSESDIEETVEIFAQEYKKKKLEQLQRKAFFSVLYTFNKASDSITATKRNEIIENLRNEFNISQETHFSFASNIQKTLIAQQQRAANLEQNLLAQQQRLNKEMEMLTGKLLTMHEKNPKTAASVPVSSASTSGSGWGNVNPESLVGKFVSVNMPDTGQFEDFEIKEYDAEQGLHRFENIDPNAMEMDEMMSWMDVREIPPEDIKWKAGEKPDLPTD